MERWDKGNLVFDQVQYMEFLTFHELLILTLFISLMHAEKIYRANFLLR